MYPRTLSLLELVAIGRLAPYDKGLISSHSKSCLLDRKGIFFENTERPKLSYLTHLWHLTSWWKIAILVAMYFVLAETLLIKAALEFEIGIL